MPIEAPAAARTVWLNRALAATALVSAWLLFQVQPMVAKRILPWFGGGTAVWTTVMLFFQTALLVGYLYAHVAHRWLSPRRQMQIHAGLLAVAALLAAVHGVLPTSGWKPVDSDAPAILILAMLTASVGLPYLMLAATAPLVQVWFARSNPGRSPYRLYALSNVGSLAALLSYPFVVEPNMGVALQEVAWSALFVGFALLCASSGLLSLGRMNEHSSAVKPLATAAPSVADAEVRPRPLQRFFWLALPACASVALLSITTHLCQDVASIPLLWIVPMVVYLLSFILTFDSDRWYRRWAWLPLAAAGSFTANSMWQSSVAHEFRLQLAADLTLLAAVCMVCHGELARMRPASNRLTSFYLFIAAGGALGGLLTGIVAPLVFVDHYELQLGVLAAWLLAIAVLATDRRSPFYDGGKGAAFAGMLGMIALTIGLTVAMYARISKQRVGAVEMARNFYGVLKVREYLMDTPERYRRLTNGRTFHGGQFLSTENRRVPMGYFDPNSGVGKILVLTEPAGPRRVGVVGLGVGALATYAQGDEVFRFYEINPEVFEFAEKHFSFLEDARLRGAKIELVEGDGRLRLEREPPQEFDLLALDAFSSDAIPTHLLTIEAFDLYLGHLKKPDGVLAVHVSNNYLDLTPIVQTAADRYELDAAIIETFPDGTPGMLGSDWVLLHRRAGYFARQKIGQPLSASTAGKPRVRWTDDYSHLLNIVR